jgi:hypothetical protein
MPIRPKDLPDGLATLDETDRLPLDRTGQPTRSLTVAALRTSLTGAGAVGGDVSGPIDDLTVEGLQGRPMDATAPNADEVLAWDGDSWKPTDLVGPLEDLIANAIAPVFEWNGADTSQFDGSDAFASAGQSITLSREAETTHPKGGFLRVTGASSGTTGTRACVRLATAPLPPLPAGAAYLFEFDVRNQGAASSYSGLSFFADLSGGAGHLFAYNYLFGGSGWKSRVDDNVLVSDGSTNNPLIAASVLGLVRVLVRGTKEGGAPPKFRINGQGHGSGIDLRSSFLKQSNYPTEPAPSGWNGLACLRWGIALQAGGGSALGTMDLDDLRIYLVR